MLLLGTMSVEAAPGMTEYQVKALFLFNFLKYVEWPPQAFENETDPLKIGVLGKNPFGGDLTRTVQGKQVAGRQVIVNTLDADNPRFDCHLLFISSSESKKLENVLSENRWRPVLTVGEDEDFLRRGGIINFSLRDGKVRLEIDVGASQKAGLLISSRLLKVADVVRK